jgi:hypothetical protein
MAWHKEGFGTAVEVVGPQVGRAAAAHPLLNPLPVNTVRVGVGVAGWTIFSSGPPISTPFSPPRDGEGGL